MNNLLLLLLVLHFIGDYYLQSEGIANSKNEAFSKVVIHGVIYMLPVIPVMLWFRDYNVFIVLLLFSVSHLLVDVIKYLSGFLMKKSRSVKLRNWWNDEEKRGSIYIVDQLVHIALIVVLVILYISSDFYIHPRMNGFLMMREMEQVLGVVLVVLVILKPVNITFKKLFMDTKPEDETFGQNRKMGQTIGNLERLLVLVLMILGQYGSIGLVFTAKSISRYNKISTNQEFAEYYLLGTLFSMLSTVVIYMIVLG